MLLYLPICILTHPSFLRSYQIAVVFSYSNNAVHIFNRKYLYIAEIKAIKEINKK